MKKHFEGLLLILIVLSIIACISDKQGVSTLDCADLIEENSDTIPFGAVSLETVKSWIEDQFNIDKAQTVYLEYPYGIDITQSIYWEVQAKDYTADFKNNQLIRLRIFWDDIKPSGGRIVECFGSPDFYSARYYQDTGGPVLTLTLWYFDKGIVATGSKPSNSTEVDKNFPIDFISFVEPSTIEDTVAKVISAGGNQGIWANVISELKPWKDDWDLIIKNETQ